MMRSITKDFLNQGMHLSDILAEMMHRVSSVAREQLIQSSSDILLSLVQIVREEVDSVDKAEGEDSLVVLEDHDIDPVIMLRGRPRPPASFGLIHPNDTLSMNVSACTSKSSFITSLGRTSSSRVSLRNPPVRTWRATK